MLLLKADTSVMSSTHSDDQYDQNGQYSQYNNHCTLSGVPSVLSTGSFPLFFIDEQALAAHEKEVMDFYYQQEQPFLTSEKLEQVQAAVTVELQRRQVDALPLEVMHAALFADPANGLELGYTLELFLEDCQSFSLNKPGEMSLAEAIDFLREMQ